MLSGETKVRGAYGWEPVSKLFAGLLPSKLGRKYTFGLAKGQHSKVAWEVVADRPHPWLLMTGETTYDLRQGDVVQANRSDCGYSAAGWLHGYLKRQGHSYGTYSLYKPYERWKTRLHHFSLKKTVLSDRTEYTFPEFPYQTWPYEMEKSYQGATYVGSFVQGFLDGAKPFSQVGFSTSEAARWFYEMCPFGGLVASGVIHEVDMKTARSRTFAPDLHKVYKFHCVKGGDHAGFKVLQSDPVEGKGLYLARMEPQPICIGGGLQVIL